MDNKTYLQQISNSNRPVKKTGLGDIFSSKLTKIVLISVAALFVVIILGSLLSGGSSNLQGKTISLKVHFDKLIETLETYQPYVKSSDLRGASASLSSISKTASSDLTEYLTAKYNFKENHIDKSIEEKEAALFDILNQELFEGKINGLLDRTFARKIAQEISTLTARESEIFNKSNDNTLRNILKTSYDSLENLYNSFNEFSETK